METVFEKFENAFQIDPAVLMDRALVNVGNTSRFAKVFEKAAKGEDIVVGAIGGSITYGAWAEDPATRGYFGRIATWFRETFPQCKVTAINAGICATTSFYGVHRAYRDLLKHNPDIVFVEFAVNDQKTKILENTYEMLVRNILDYPTQPAVMLLCSMAEGGNNVQEFHQKCAKHYQLPLVSYRDAFWPEIAQEHMKWEDVTADCVHPNDDGHQAYALFCTEMLSRMMKGTCPMDNSPYTMPESTCYEALYNEKPISFKNARMVMPDEMKAHTEGDVKIADMPYGEKAYEISKNGVLHVDISGYSAVACRYAYFNRSDMGWGMVTVNDGDVRMHGDTTKRMLDGYFPVEGANTANNEVLVTGLDTTAKCVLNVANVDMNKEYADGVTGDHFYVFDLMVSE